jgi:hypothetical protein
VTPLGFFGNNGTPLRVSDSIGRVNACRDNSDTTFYSSNDGKDNNIMYNPHNKDTNGGRATHVKKNTTMVGVNNRPF